MEDTFALREKESQTIMRLTDALKPAAGWCKSTVITFLKRMMDKQAVIYDQVDNAENYYSVAKRKNVVIRNPRL